ncbi:hypothetical protein HNR46_001604 [Haloferula luteola]|uniref:Uncharacterized protein n=1 Tax=Haloferula luteola TaxID=595692 RepID=A0A840V9J6_9BACT|nr:hypothetical protein [Haloferula luteola]MBB5351368.1 hypothetical protein [Haloferula luteola]
MDYFSILRSSISVIAATLALTGICYGTRCPETGRFTKAGRIMVVLIGISCILTIALEFLASHSSRTERERDLAAFSAIERKTFSETVRYGRFQDSTIKGWPEGTASYALNWLTLPIDELNLQSKTETSRERCARVYNGRTSMMANENGDEVFAYYGQRVRLRFSPRNSPISQQDWLAARIKYKELADIQLKSKTTYAISWEPRDDKSYFEFLEWYHDFWCNPPSLPTTVMIGTWEHTFDYKESQTDLVLASPIGGTPIPRNVKMPVLVRTYNHPFTFDISVEIVDAVPQGDTIHYSDYVRTDAALGTVAHMHRYWTVVDEIAEENWPE